MSLQFSQLAPSDLATPPLQFARVKPRRYRRHLKRHARQLPQPEVAAAVTRFWSGDRYTIYLYEGEEQMIETSITTLVRHLPDFVRIHRAELVRLDAITALVRTRDRWYALLVDGQRAQIARRLVKQVHKLIAEQPMPHNDSGSNLNC